MNQQHLNTIIEFYQAFKDKDAEKMTSFYAENIDFEDAAFGKLHGEEAKKMWRMLIVKGKDLEIEYSNIRFENGVYKAHWDAEYTFSATRRKVNNHIDAEFIFNEEGKIVKHHDSFDFHLWASQAFGFVGKVFGRTNFFHQTFQKKAKKLLKEYKG